MIAACAPFDPLGRYVGSVLAWVDCRTMGLGEEAFRALGPGSPFGAALTGLLTIYVALIGYRLLLGGELTVREGMFAALKIGLVLALSTQWPAWRVLVYDVATKTPEAAAAGLLRATGGIEGLERVRFTSPHPSSFTDDVIDAMAETPVVMPQLHMPLQSGSDTILKAMRAVTQEAGVRLVDVTDLPGESANLQVTVTPDHALICRLPFVFADVISAALSVCVAVWELASARVTVAELKSKMETPRPAELDRLNMFVGTWESEGEAQA